MGTGKLIIFDRINVRFKSVAWRLFLAAKSSAVAWPGRSIDRTGKHTPSPCRYVVSK